MLALGGRGRGSLNLRPARSAHRVPGLSVLRRNSLLLPPFPPQKLMWEEGLLLTLQGPKAYDEEDSVH